MVTTHCRDLPFPAEAHDLVGCRYRLVQRAFFPDVASTAASQARAQRHDAIAQDALAHLPTGPALGDKKEFSRYRCVDEFDTLEALAQGHTLIENARFVGDEVAVTVDLLVRQPAGTYMPVVVSSHRVAREAPHRVARFIATSRLGLGTPVEGAYKLRHHVVDGYRIAAADLFLQQVGLSSGVGGAIGQDPTRCFLVETESLLPAFMAALELPLPAAARRVKECRTCRYWFDCGPQLEARDDISLYLSGDVAQRYRERGITTVSGLIDSGEYPDSVLAAAWRAGIRFLRLPTNTTPVPVFDVEIDIDMEAYLDQGAYLWGALTGDEYRPFVTFDGLGATGEADNFAAFWAWLTNELSQARAAGKSAAVFCFSAHGENHWLLQSARRFAGHTNPDGRTVPTVEEVKKFISSPEWVDVFKLVSARVVSPFGMGLKDLAPAAGFHFSEEDLAGEASMDAFARADEDESLREKILRYNEEDCRAARAVRRWLAEGCPGAPVLPSPPVFPRTR